MQNTQWFGAASFSQTLDPDTDDVYGIYLHIKIITALAGQGAIAAES